ncbi:MAG TPA: radical SAM protein [Armatimonadetes bacterium]|nr:radical SAM protein [Armatimonadota bacterium]
MSEPRAKCSLIAQGYAQGACETRTSEGKTAPACAVTLRRVGGAWQRVIRSIHLSRPEHYLSIYQSGCNHHCRKCHSAEFSKCVNGDWISTDDLAELAAQYAQHITVWEPRERATMWHATDLCRGCGACVLYGKRGALCPGVLDSQQVVFSPQGFGPARNIVAFTGGDLACRAEFYAEATRKIKARSPNLWVLLETNGYGLTPTNLDLLAEAGLDAFWLDLKAYDEAVYRALCGTTNEWILRAPEEIVRRGMVVEVLTLYLPGWVETDQIARLARLVAQTDPNIPFTLLAFFPAYRLQEVRRPTVEEMLTAYEACVAAGLRHLKLGNCGVFTRTEADWERLLTTVGASALG